MRIVDKIRWTAPLMTALISLLTLCRSAYGEEVLRVPAFTAYSEPDAEALNISEQHGITGWKDLHEKVVWYGFLKNPGMLHLATVMRLNGTGKTAWRLTVAKRTLSAEKEGSGGQSVKVDFGQMEVPAPGNYRFELEGVRREGNTFGQVEALLLDGPAAKEAHFNLNERRNAASVHLGYPLPKEAKVIWFYNEVTVKEDPIWSYYMACGFRRGYFGIQVNSPTERRIIFSVWDSGNEAIDRSKVSAEDRVQLLAKGEGVVASDFGNEGTGGHSHLVYPWKNGHTYRFLVTAQPDGTHTTYSGYFYFPEKKSWGLIARFRAPKDGEYLRGLYSFNENFGGANGQRLRYAEFGNQWVKMENGDWQELLTARFTHDPTGKEDRKDYSGGVAQGRFFLANGGFRGAGTLFGTEFHRPASGKPPTDFNIPTDH